VSSFNELDHDRYYDPESQSSFAFDHGTQVWNARNPVFQKTKHGVESVIGPIPRTRVGTF